MIPPKDDTSSAEIIRQLKEENRTLREQEKNAFSYIRSKINQLLVLMDTVPLKDEELEDNMLISLDPIGIVCHSFAQILENLHATNDRLNVANKEIEIILDSVQAGILVLDSECHIVNHNKKMKDLFRSESPVIGQPCNMTLCDKTLLNKDCIIKKVLACEEIIHQQNWLKNGKFYDVTATPVKTDSNSINYFVVMYTDITQRKLSEEQLIQSEEQYRDLFENATDMIQIADIDGKLIFANKAWQRTMGYTATEIPNLSLFDLLSPSCLKQYRQIHKKLLSGEDVRTFEVTFLNKDDQEILLETSVSCKLENNRPVTIRHIFRDITSERKMHNEIQQIQKLKSLGILAGGLAHDFNNLLTVITGNISLVQSNETVQGADFTYLEKAMDACWKARDLAQQLLTFSKGGTPITRCISPSRVITKCIDFFMCGSHIKCISTLPETLWNIEADEGQINQVMQNLLLNCSEAMPGGGTITILAENKTIRQPDHRQLEPGKYVKISVQDQGHGIAPAHLPTIFDPYFTTKEQGNGLGLAITYSIVKKHGGAITVTSQLGKGSNFNVFLPACPDTAKTYPPSDNDQRKKCKSTASKKILIMDDEEIIRDVASQMLASLGNDVQCVEDGNQAITTYRDEMETGHPFDLVIMDLTIPGGMGGQEAVQQILKIDPQARVIVSSGYANDPVMSQFREYGFCGVMKKPYTLEELKKISC